MGIEFIKKRFANKKEISHDKGKGNITMLFTHDLHNHLISSKVLKDGKVKALGGFDRLKSAIDEERKNNPNLLLIDGGDFSMGTLFQSIYSSDSPELRIMGEMGYDVLTFGNHEYDYMAKGLAQSLIAAKNKSSCMLPKIVQSNYMFGKNEDGNLSESLSCLKDAMEEYGVKEYEIIERSGIKIGVFGVMGKDAAIDAPMAEVQFGNYIKSSRRIVKILRDKGKVDLIICLSHSGTNVHKSKSEDEILAKKVPDIDVIVSAHSHTILRKPIIIGKTIIGSCGENGENLGIIKISQDNKNTWKLDKYEIKQIDSNLKSDTKILKSINEFKVKVENDYLKSFNMDFDEVLARSSFNFSVIEDIWNEYGENGMGNLISDAYIHAVKKAEGANYEEIAVSIIPTGIIRASFVKGNITVSDVFNVSSLGMGGDLKAGYPLVSAYLTGKELKTVCEVDASISPLMKTVQLHMSGISFIVNPKKIIFRRATQVKLKKADGTMENIDDKKLYRVVVGLYSAQMLSLVGKKSFGLLSIVPKTKEGVPIIDFEAHIVRDKSEGYNKEVKEWIALAELLKAFDKVDGIPQIPEYYNKAQGRKVIK